jgi:hypothetical protein
LQTETQRAQAQRAQAQRAQAHLIKHLAREEKEKEEKKKKTFLVLSYIKNKNKNKNEKIGPAAKSMHHSSYHSFRKINILLQIIFSYKCIIK